MARIDELERGLVDQNGEQVVAELRDGKEYGDPVPKAPPLHMQRMESQAEIIKRMVRQELSSRAHEAGYETFEEAEDFDVDDDPADPHTPYEAVFDPPPPLKEDADGDEGRDEGRSGPAGSGSGKSGEVGKGKPAKDKPAPDKGGAREAAAGDPGSEGED